jgi:hypothetical protein
MIAEWIENLRFDIIEPIGMVLVGVIWFLTLLKIVRGGLREHGQVAEGIGGGGGAARSSSRELYLEVLKNHAVGMATATALAVLFFAFAANLEELTEWGVDLFESARPA